MDDTGIHFIHERSRGPKPLSIVICDYHAHRLDRIRGQADLIFKGGSFYLYVVIAVPKPPKIKSDGVLGVGLGVKNIAVDQAGESFSGEKTEEVRTKMDNLKADIQSCGAKSIKMHLKEPSGKEAELHQDTNHCISKKIVAKTICASSLIALEDLHDAHERSTVRLSQRCKQRNRSFYQLRQFIVTPQPRRSQTSGWGGGTCVNYKDDFLKRKCIGDFIDLGNERIDWFRTIDIAKYTSYSPYL